MPVNLQKVQTTKAKLYKFLKDERIHKGFKIVLCKME